jgi:hypothetical protein
MTEVLGSNSTKGKIDISVIRNVHLGSMAHPACYSRGPEKRCPPGDLKLQFRLIMRGTIPPYATSHMTWLTASEMRWHMRRNQISSFGETDEDI